MAAVFGILLKGCREKPRKTGPHFGRHVLRLIRLDLTPCSILRVLQRLELLVLKEAREKAVDGVDGVDGVVAVGGLQRFRVP